MRLAVSVTARATSTTVFAPGASEAWLNWTAVTSARPVGQPVVPKSASAHHTVDPSVFDTSSGSVLTEAGEAFVNKKVMSGELLTARRNIDP